MSFLGIWIKGIANEKKVRDYLHKQIKVIYTIKITYALAKINTRLKNVLGERVISNSKGFWIPRLLS